MLALGWFYQRTFHWQFSKWWTIDDIYNIFKQIGHILYCNTVYIYIYIYIYIYYTATLIGHVSKLDLLGVTCEFLTWIWAKTQCKTLRWGRFSRSYLTDHRWSTLFAKSCLQGDADVAVVPCTYVTHTSVRPEETEWIISIIVYIRPGRCWQNNQGKVIVRPLAGTPAAVARAQQLVHVPVFSGIWNKDYLPSASPFEPRGLSFY